MTGEHPPKKFIVAGDSIPRENGELEYVDALRLCRLYGISPEEAVLTDRRQPSYRYILRKYPGLRVLGPRADGNYDAERI